MMLVPIDPNISISARSELRLRSGDFISLKVIRHLVGDKWAVGIKGRIVPARSTLKLLPGQRLRAQVALQHGQYVLKLAESSSNPVRELLLRLGLQQDAVMEQVLTSFMRHGLPVRSRTLRQVRNLLDRRKLDARKFSRIAAACLEKEIEPDSPGLERLLAVLGYGEGEAGSGRKRYRQRQMPPDEHALAGDLQAVVEQPDSGEGNSLQLFNHLKGHEAHWIFVPFDYSFKPSGRIYGTIRLRYDTLQNRADRLVLVARTAEDMKWSFLMQRNAEGEWKLYVFGPKGGGRKMKAELQLLQLKLQNLGIKMDDTIREDQDFDGFSLPWEELSYRVIDTVQ
jgi:hypothetical protein